MNYHNKTEHLLTSRFRLPIALLLAMVFFAVGLVARSKVHRLSLERQPTVARETSAPVARAELLPAMQPAAFIAESVKSRADVCSLLSSKQIQSVQGERAKETTASMKSEGGLSVAQCFFTLPTFTNSISLAVTRRAEGNGARNPRDFWNETFPSERASKVRDKDRDSQENETRERDHDSDGTEEKEEDVAPQRIEGVGNEAFWLGNAIGGALYVLKDNAFVRISIGGPSDQRTKINRSRMIARLVLKNL
jgi:hypothetical protein